MDKRALSETDIITKFILPAVKNSGWDIMYQIKQEVYLRDGKVVVRGKIGARKKVKAEQKWWGQEKDGFKARKENQQAWKVDTKDTIERNYNVDIKKPHIEEQIQHDPEELLADYAQGQKDIQCLRNQLKQILNEAPSGKGKVNTT